MAAVYRAGDWHLFRLDGRFCHRYDELYLSLPLPLMLFVCGYLLGRLLYFLYWEYQDRLQWQRARRLVEAR